MATIHVVLATVRGSGYAGSLPIPASVTAGNDTVTSSGTSALSTLTGQPGQVWCVTAKDGDVWLKFGPGTPVAAAEEGWLLTAGNTRDLTVSDANEKLAIKDA
jgi:hypothetical protein